MSGHSKHNLKTTSGEWIPPGSSGNPAENSTGAQRSSSHTDNEEMVVFDFEKDSNRLLRKITTIFIAGTWMVESTLGVPATTTHEQKTQEKVGYEAHTTEVPIYSKAQHKSANETPKNESVISAVTTQAVDVFETAKHKAVTFIDGENKITIPVPNKGSLVSHELIANAVVPTLQEKPEPTKKVEASATSKQNTEEQERVVHEAWLEVKAAGHKIGEEQFAGASKKHGLDKVLEEFRKLQPTATPTLIPTKVVEQPASPYLAIGEKPRPGVFKYQELVEAAADRYELPLIDYHLIRASENQSENPTAINYTNSNGTLDVGWGQKSVPKTDKEEIEKLKDPAYNIDTISKLLRKYKDDMRDPILTLGAYNRGEQGALWNPKAALKRAQHVYWKAGVPMPETEFTKDPVGYVEKNRSYYEGLGFQVLHY